MRRRSAGYVFSCGATAHKVAPLSVTDRHRQHIVPQCLGNGCDGGLIATSVIPPHLTSFQLSLWESIEEDVTEVYLIDRDVHLL